MNSALRSFLFSPIIGLGLTMAMLVEPPEVAALGQLGHIGVGQANLIKRIDFPITGFWPCIYFQAIYRSRRG